MVRLEGFEPSTSGSTIQRSNQLSYSRMMIYFNLIQRIGQA